MTDVDGNKWQADTEYVGGHTSTTTDSVDSTRKQYVFHDDRYGMSAYRIPVVNGTYDVTLLEAETYFTAAGKRVFSVTAEGRTVAKDVDVFARAGGKDKAYWIKFTTTVADGWLDLGFTASVNHPKVNGISVLPAGSASPAPTPTGTPSQTPSSTPSPTPSSTPSPTPSATPTPTPTPTVSDTRGLVLWGMDDNADFDSTEAAVGRKFAVVREYLRMDQSFVSSREQALVDSGHSLVISAKARTGSAAIPFSDIVAGKWDSQLLAGLQRDERCGTDRTSSSSTKRTRRREGVITASSDSVCGPQFAASAARLRPRRSIT